MNRALAATAIAAVLIAALPAVPDGAGAQAPARGRAAVAVAPDEDRIGTWVGTIGRTDVAVAVVSNGEVVRAYACDGNTVSAWFEGKLVGDSFAMTAPDGSTITGALAGGSATGVFTSTDAPIGGVFTAQRPTGSGGVFRSNFVTQDQATVFIRWIVFDDGTQRGNAETSTVPPAGSPAPPAKTTPAPPLDVAAARIEQSVPVAPAREPAPVTELTPTSITAAVPTTIAAGAPPPIPPPAPPAVQPVSIAATVTPSKADVGTPVQYQLTLTNPNKTELVNAGVRVGLPPSLAVAPSTEKSTCKGTFVAFPPGTTKAGQPQIIVSGVSLAPGASCTADVGIVATAPVAVDVVTDAPTADGAPPGTPARATFVIGSSVAAPASAPQTTPTTTTTPPTTTTTKPSATTTTKTPTTTTTAPQLAPQAAPASGTPSAPRNVTATALALRAGDGPKDGRIEVTFNPPASDGGAPVTTFLVFCRSAIDLNDDVSELVRAPATSVTLTGAAVDVEYSCQATATNGRGFGPNSEPAARVTVNGRPSAPRNVTATALALRAGDGPKDGRIEVTFNPPASDGGAPVTTFLVFCRSAIDLNDDVSELVRAPATSVTLTGAAVDVEYSCQATATNGRGFGPNSEPAARVTVNGRPSAPRNVTATALALRVGDGPKDGRIEVTFNPPASDGGAPVTTFLVFCRSAIDLNDDVSELVRAPATSVTLTGAAVDVEYSCQATATNGRGFGPNSEPAARVTVNGRPSAPRNVTATALALRAGDGPKDGRIEVTFNPPASDGGAPVTTFLVFCRSAIDLNDDVSELVRAPATSVTLTGAAVDVEYSCQATATNGRGFGPNSEPAARVTVNGKPSTTTTLPRRPSTPTTRPSTTPTTTPTPTKPLAPPTAPREVEARALPLRERDGRTDGRIDVGFLEPESDGGSPIRRFDAQCSTFVPPGVTDVPNNVGGTATSSPVTVSGLQVDLPYTCSVTAISEAELEGPAGFAKPVTIAGRPGPPRDVNARALPLGSAGPQAGRAEVSFTPPVDTGAPPVTGFVARCEAKVPTPTRGEFLFLFAEGSGPTSPVPVAGLTVDFSYECSVAAVNRIGEGQGIRANPIAVNGSLSGARDVQAKPLPLRPGDGARDGRFEVTFTPPDDGAPAATTFVVTCIAPAFSRTFGQPHEVTVDGSASPVTVPGIELDRTYTCNVVGINQVGRGAAAFAPPTLVPGRPGLPREVDVKALPLRAGDGPDGGRVEVTFRPPEDNGSPPVTSFSVDCLSPTTTPAGVPTNLIATAFEQRGSPVTVTGLRVDAPYRCNVAAVNQIGQGTGAVAPKSVTVTREPTTTTTSPSTTSTTSTTSATTTTTTSTPVDAKPPGPPGRPVATLLPPPTDATSDGQILVEFATPANDGGSPITGYLVTCIANATTSAAANGKASPITVPGVPAGFVYPCVVQAENRVGLGEPSERSNLVPVPIPASAKQPPSQPPGQPTATALPPRATDGSSDGRITVEFAEAEKDGGSPIQGYNVTCTDSAGNFAFREFGPKSPMTVTGVAYGFRYVCKVDAENEFGAGEASKTSNEVALPLPPSIELPPSPPREVVAEALPPKAGAGPAEGEIVVRFIAPAKDGGSAITGYQVVCTDNQTVGERASGAESPLTVTGLPAGTYRCVVQAVNDVGAGDEATSNSVTVLAPPVVPRLVATPTGGSAPLSTTFGVENPPEKVASWTIDFGDGAPTVKGQGAVPAIPHTYLNKTDQAITLHASVTVTPTDDTKTVLATQVEVQPEGTILTVDGTPDPKTFQRGGGGFVTLSVRNPNPAPVAGPLTLSVPPELKATFATGAWACGESSCTLGPGLEAFAEAPTLVVSLTAPPDAPATLDVPIEVSTGSGRAQDVVRIPVVGVVANAGPDQTVDATTPQPDGTLAPTRVLLDAGASLGLDGKNQTFKWRQSSGTPQVNLDTSVDPTNRVVVFDAPPVTTERALEFELTVTQGANESRDTVRVTAVPRNQPPVLETINVSGLTTRTRSSGEVVPEGAGTLKLTRDATDPDGDKLTTTWRVLTAGVPNPTGVGETFSLDWPVVGVPQVVVEATVTDPRGATDTETVTLGTAPTPLGLEVAMPARVDPREAVSAQATPSRTSGVQVQWGLVSGPTLPGFPKSGRSISFDAPDVSTTQIVTLSVTAIETATGASATRQVSVQVDAPPPLVVSAPPSVSVDPGAPASVEATVVGGSNPTFEWRQTFGPNVTLVDADKRTVRFDAPSDPTTIGLRLRVTAAGVTRTADTIVTVGDAGAAPASGCGPGSAYRQLANGGTVVFGGIAVLSGVSAQGSNAACDEATLDGVDINLLGGLVIGDGVSGTFDQGGIRFTGGDVRLPDAFQLPPIDLGANPLEILFDGGGGTQPATQPGGTQPGGGGGDGPSCINFDAGFASRDFPFVPLPPGFSSGGASLAVDCDRASISANATGGGATFAVEADLADGGADATVTLTNVPLLGGTASGAGTITVAPGGAPTYDLAATIENPELAVPGLALATATARLTPAGLTVSAEGALGEGNGALAVSMEGSFAETGLSLAVEANNAGPWEVGPELSVDAANLVGTIDVDAAGAVTVDLRLSVGGDWRPVPGLRVRQLSLQVANTAVPAECAIPAGGLWVRASGEGAIEIPGVSPLALAVEACLGPPIDAGTPAFSLRSTIGGPQWQVADGVVIRDVAIQVTLVGDTLTLQASGGATLLGLDLTARVLFLLPTGAGQPTVLVDAAGSLAGLGVPITSGHVVFASAAVPDFAVEPGLALDIPQGITGIGTIDLGQPIADLLNQAFSPPTPILPRVTVTLSFGAAIEIKAAINLGGEGATLFMGCPGGGTGCSPTAPTTTRLALDSAFIRLVVGGSGGFSIGFGGDGTLNLPPAEEGGPASPLDLHVEASIQPPARVGLALFFEGAWQNAMGLSGLTLSNLGIQGSIDFSTTPIPTVTMGITGQVDHVPNQLAGVLGLTNNGEPQRFTLNVDPLAPILELTLGVDDGAILMRPLTAVGQPNALEVDFASVVVAPLGGTVGPVTYSPGVSAGFAANILDVAVHVNASVDIAAAHINGTVEVGTLTVAGVRFEDTTILLDLTPQRFRQTVCGGVHIGTTTLQGLLHIQAGSGGGGPATCGGVSLDPTGSGAGLRARFRLNAESLPVGPVNVEQLTVDAQATLNALSGNFAATLNATAKLDVLANELDVNGTIRFGNGTLDELHVKALGNLNVGGVQITGTGSCPFGAGGNSGACVQLDHAPATSTPFRFGLKGQLNAAGSTASVTGSLDPQRAALTGTLAVPTLGTLIVSGTLVYAGGGTIANATGTNVSATTGDWRVSGQFATPKPLAGGVSAAWRFAAGRVSNGIFVRGSADTSIGGATVQLAGTFSATSSGTLTYSLTGSSNGAVSATSVGLATTGGGAFNLLHSAIRTGVFNTPGLSPIGGRPSDERFPERMRGRIHFDASYDLAVTLSQNGLAIDEADLAARVIYGERFDRDGSGAFGEETESQRNTLVNFDLDASGIDEFFAMTVARAATRTQAATFCFSVFGNQFGAC